MKNTYVKDYEQTFSIRGEDIFVKAPARYDSVTNEMLYDAELDDAAIEMAYDIYRKKNGYLNPSSIRKMREDIGISQRDFATLMGWSQTTIVLYENDALPTKNNNNQLKMIYENPLELQQYFNNAKESFSTKTSQKIADYLLKHRNREVDNEISVFDIVDWFRVTNIKEMEKSEVVEPLTQLKVMKLLYYAQGLMMAKFKKKLFADPLYAWNYGPVVRSVYNEYKGSRSIIDDIIFDLPKELVLKFEKINNNQQILEVLTFVQNNLGHLSAISLMNKTHLERPWVVTGKDEEISDDLIQEYFEENIFEIFSV
jgi:putative zinc finger/helix-turn-helix YgiT family protein